MLSLEVDVISSKPSMELRLFSRSLVRLVSISEPELPGYVHITDTYGGSISGYWSIGSLDNANMPMIITATNINEVVTGLSIAVL